MNKYNGMHLGGNRIEVKYENPQVSKREEEEKKNTKRGRGIEGEEEATPILSVSFALASLLNPFRLPRSPYLPLPLSSCFINEV